MLEKSKEHWELTEDERVEKRRLLKERQQLQDKALSYPKDPRFPNSFAAFIVVAGSGVLFTLAAMLHEDNRQESKVGKEATGEPGISANQKIAIPEASGLIVKKVSIPSAKIQIFELELANGEKTALPVDNETYGSRKVGDLIPLEPPKKKEVKLEYY